MPVIVPPLSSLAAVGLSYFLTAALAIKAFGTLSPIWYSNAIVLVALLRHPPRTWRFYLLVAWLADTAAVSLFGDGPAPMIALCDMVEVALAATLVERTGGLRAPLFAGSQIARVVAACLLAPILSSGLGAMVLTGFEHEPFMAAWRIWYSASALGFVTAAPFLLCWTDEATRNEILQPLTPRALLVLAGNAVLAVVLVLQREQAALLFLTFPLVFALTWMYGLLGATVGMVTVMAASLFAAFYGPRDIFTLLMPESELTRRIEAVQVYLAAMLMSSLPLAVLRAHQRELLQELRRVGNARADFLAAMSHEIRTPMTGVLGMADLLAQEPLTGRQHKYVEAMRSSGRHLLSVLNDILDFSRIESGRLELEAIDFAVEDVVEGMRSLMHPIAVEHGLDLRLQVEGDEPLRLRGDPLRLRQVLINLVNNAIKFTERGGVTVRVSRHPTDDPQRITVLFEVRDTGIGIDAARLEQLFSPFMQADRSISRQYGGSGLGLAISKRLVEAMGGRIGATSRPGEGSTFYFDIPFLIGSAPLAAPVHSAPTAAQRPQRILVAEDVEINRELLDTVLSRQGHELRFANDGLQAVALAEQEDFDLVLMDVQMPVLDGVAATRRIRQLPGPRGQVPIVGVTANVMARERELYLGAGMDDCLTKPIQWDQLAAAVAHHGRGEQLAPAPVAVAAAPAEAGDLIDDGTVAGLRALFNEDGLADLFARGLEGYDEGCRGLRAEGATRDEVRHHAHAIKGSSATLGFSQVSALAREIEEAAPGAPPERIAELGARLAQLLAATRAALVARGMLAQREKA